MDFGDGALSGRLVFSESGNTSLATVYADGTPIGTAALSGDAAARTEAVFPVDRTGGVREVTVTLDGHARLHDLRFSAEPAFGKSDYVPTPEEKLIDFGADGWEATDMLGRRVASVEDVRGRKKDKKVGIFYWTWRESHAHLRPVDVVDVLEKYPAAEYRKDHPAWGEHPFQCHWHEPFYGFYRNSDPWVIRHHAALLAAAGVDMIMFDCTNGALLWRDAYEPLLRGLHEAREDGIRTPQVAFMMNFGPVHTTELMLRALYQNLYKPGLYSDLWFRLDGKPLVMAYPDALPETGVCETDTRLLEEIRNFFTFRPGQPLYAGGAVRPDQWGWLEVFPQNKYVTRPDGSCEQVTVGVGQNANAQRICTHFNDRDTFGRSYTGRDGFAHLSPDSYKYGYNVQEQWDRAIDLDPDIVFVTGWNEWIMGQFHEPWLSDNDSTQLAMVDQYDREHSRDIEMDKDGYLDTYYLQLAHNIRRFKGAGARQPVSAEKTVAVGAAVAGRDAGVPQSARADPAPGLGRLRQLPLPQHLRAQRHSGGACCAGCRHRILPCHLCRSHNPAGRRGMDDAVPQHRPPAGHRLGGLQSGHQPPVGSCRACHRGGIPADRRAGQLHVAGNRTCGSARERRQSDAGTAPRLHAGG